MSVSCLYMQDVQQDSQTTLERKTLRRAFYSREAKNQIDDEDEGNRFSTFLKSFFEANSMTRSNIKS